MRRRAWRAAAALLALTLSAGACYVGTSPWVAPSLRILYRADGPGRAGIRFLVARKDNEIAISLNPTRGQQHHRHWQCNEPQFIDDIFDIDDLSSITAARTTCFEPARRSWRGYG